MFKKIGLTVILLIIALFTIITWTFASPLQEAVVTNTDVASENSQAPKNIILFIGDGMSPSLMTPYRHYSDDTATAELEQTAFDPHLVGQQMTHSADTKETITDSAAAATALATGEKTYHSAVGVDGNGEQLHNVIEAAKTIDMSTGLVVTSEVIHATPANFFTHVRDRDRHSEIADASVDDIIKNELKVDVLLGGGLKHFNRSDRNLVSELQERGYTYVSSKQELLDSDSDLLLGLFAEEGLPMFLDRDEDIPSLKDMTKAAISRLSKDEDGFFLMVEGSQIDWGGHSNDISSMMSEMTDFEQAFEAALDFAEADGDTLVLVTADHGTGGFSMGVDGENHWNPEPIRQMKRTPQFLAQKIVNEGTVVDLLEEYVEWDFEVEEISAIQTALSNENPSSSIRAILSKAVDKRSYTGWTTDGHTGEDVNVYAFGPKSELWHGLSDNTSVAKNIFEVLEEKE
ncbi:alkaline phosphatase [Alkalibacterium iburiense]|uniref:Alkaline phosphatase n=1 Tax=Alkalibacterium iburiense TaxID=290589 RepID=A0ABN0XM90_9LACT